MAKPADKVKVRENKYIKYIDLNQLFNWSVQGLLDSKFNYTKNFELARIGDFLIKSRSLVNIEDDVLYKRVTVRINNNGVTLRDTQKGVNIGTKKQYAVKAGQFIVSKIDARNGAFGIIPEGLEGAIVTNDFPLFDVNREKILPQFLLLITTTKVFVKFAQSCSSGTTNRQRMDIEMFLNQKIPLPSLAEQNRIMSAFEKKLREAQKLEEDVAKTNDELETCLFQKLSIKNQIIQSLKPGLNFINFSKLNAWGLDKILRGDNEGVLVSNKFPNRKLSELIYVNPRTDLKELKDSDDMSFIPMECVSDEYGEVIELRSGKKSKSGGYTKFQEGDLIWARITPCMQNGKSAVIQGLKNKLGYGSTEFHVLRAKDKTFSIAFTYHLLRSLAVRMDAINHFTGSAGQQRVPKEYLENLIVPVPPIQIQNEISKHLNELKEKKRNLTQKADASRLSAIKEFEKEIFH